MNSKEEHIEKEVARLKRIGAFSIGLGKELLQDACRYGGITESSIKKEYTSYQKWLPVPVLDKAISVDLPPPETALAIDHPNIDTLGAIAVLQLRQEGVFGEPARLRAKELSYCMDSATDWTPVVGTVGNVLNKDALMLFLSRSVVMDNQAIKRRLKAIRSWLATGSFPYAPTIVSAIRREREEILKLHQQVRLIDDRGGVGYIQSVNPLALKAASYSAGVAIVEESSARPRPVTVVANTKAASRWIGRFGKVMADKDSVEWRWYDETTVGSLASRMSLYGIVAQLIRQNCLFYADHCIP